ncbi:MAG: hypothetical protein ACI4EI_08235, partial [Muricoprocola sp.]
MPKKSELASMYPRLANIYNKLEKENEAIYQREQQLVSVEKEITGTKGIFKGKQRKELQEQMEQLQTQIENMRRYLPTIVQGYGYKNVKDFLAKYQASKAEYGDYRKAVVEWENLTGERVDVPLFCKVCNYMIDYSYGRHTYMPSTCRSFVKANMGLMSDEALMGIVDYLKKRNADIPEEESSIDKIDSDNWIYMQEDLEAELLTRQMFYEAQEKAGDM